MANFNHPPKNSIIKVEPIQRRSDRRKIESMQAGHPRNGALFITGCNTNLRASDLVRLTVGHVRNLRPGDELILREQKTKKVRKITVNKKVVAAIQKWLAVHPRAGDDAAPLFVSYRGGKALTVSSLSRLVKQWCKDAGLVGNFASHSLRKTFGYVMRVEHGVGIGVLMRMFNHSSERQTLTYLCISDEEVRHAYLMEV